MITATKPERSLVAATEDEAVRHKWIESEKAGSDLGHYALHDWVRRHWDPFLRQRWVEHLLGHVFWYELDHSSFGLFRHVFEDNSLGRLILVLYKSGGPEGENLGIIQRAQAEDWPMDEVFEILELLNINSRRLECQFHGRLIINFEQAG